MKKYKHRFLTIWLINTLFAIIAFNIELPFYLSTTIILSNFFCTIVCLKKMIDKKYVLLTWRRVLLFAPRCSDVIYERC